MKPKTVQLTITTFIEVQVLSCAFCDSLNLDIVKGCDMRNTLYYIRCNTCSSCGPTDGTEVEAVRKWNIRCNPWVTKAP